VIGNMANVPVAWILFPIALVSVTFIPNGYSHHRNRNFFPRSIRHLHNYSPSTRVNILRRHWPDISILLDEEWTLQCVRHGRRHFYGKIKEEEQKMSSIVVITLLAIHRTVLFCSTYREH
jgi:hypothetical protein